MVGGVSASHPSTTSILQVPHAPSPPQTWLTRMSSSPAMDSIVFPAGNSPPFPASAKVTRGIGWRFYRAVGHIRAAHQRRRLHVMEPELPRAASELRELLGRVVAAHRMV